MATLAVLLALSGYIALLLWGLHMVQSGVQRTFGTTLAICLSRAAHAPMRTFATGLGITTAVQSSTATARMVGSLVERGTMALSVALAGMLGANVGTSLVVQWLSSGLTALAPGLILAGVWLFRHYPPSRQRDMGRVLIGLGLILLALHQLVFVLAPLQNSTLASTLLALTVSYPISALTAAATMTWACRSSAAVVIVVMSLTGHGLLDVQSACVLVLGANLGASVTPAVEALRHGPAARRLPIGNLMLRIPACAAGLALLYWIPDLAAHLSTQPDQAVANFHTLFNVVSALVFLPLLPLYARLLHRLFPGAPVAPTAGAPVYIGSSTTTPLANVMGSAAREALRLSDMLQNMLSTARAGQRRNLSQIREMGAAIDHLAVELTAFLARMDTSILDEDQRLRRDGILTYVSHMASAARITADHLFRWATALSEQQPACEADTQHDLSAFMDRLMDNQRQAALLLMNGDLESARRLAREKERFRAMESEIELRQIDCIRGEYLSSDCAASQGQPRSNHLYLEIVRCIKAINGHLVSAAAYPVLARHDELLPNRLRNARG
ncbi:Na/Pi cotransporter family protein [Allopusillimonas soli]|uniref:Na/Pi cotransporter family protein n=1 Tax=Allopusillimonas soli TaxID=659016 RepID=A0A853F648_9BURK|nr:Na/Pi cotransporter family protein [Allopusillimonas soli]NYT35318.1 Na/Pi cotransporter family protein [Allopusillimonas soli]TEA75740.1 Na/Pi cotransporter family protein [Allopusillimonas soli]